MTKIKLLFKKVIIKWKCHYGCVLLGNLDLIMKSSSRGGSLFSSADYEYALARYAVRATKQTRVKIKGEYNLLIP